MVRIRSNQLIFILVGLLALFLLQQIFLSSSNVQAASGIAPDSVVAMAGNPTQAAYASDLNKLYVTEFNTNSISVIDTLTNTIITTIQVGLGPFGIAYDAPAHKIYVADSTSKELSVIDAQTDKLIHNIEMNETVQGVVYDPITGWILVTDNSNNSLLELSDTYDIVANTIPVGIQPSSVAIDTDNGNAYVSNFVSGTVTMIDGLTNNPSWTANVGVHPYALAVDSNSSRLFVVNSGSNSVSVLNDLTGSFIAQITVNSAPAGIALDSVRGYVYVSASGSNTLWIFGLDNLKFIKSDEVGAFPLGVTLGGRLANIYVCNKNSNSIQDIFIGINFIESELPSGTLWNVEVGDTTLSSSSGTISFPESFGDYSFSIISVKGYTAKITEGTVHVDGDVTYVVSYVSNSPAFFRSFTGGYLIPWFNSIAELSTSALILMSLFFFCVEVIGVGILCHREDFEFKDFIFSLIAVGAVFFGYLLQSLTHGYSYIFGVIFGYNMGSNNMFANLAVLVFVLAVIASAIAFFVETIRVYIPDFIALACFFFLTHSISSLRYSALLPDGLTFATILQVGWLFLIGAITAIIGFMVLSCLMIQKTEVNEHVRLLPFVFLGLALDLTAPPFFFLICLFYIPIALFISSISLFHAH